MIPPLDLHIIDMTTGDVLLLYKRCHNLTWERNGHKNE